MKHALINMLTLQDRMNQKVHPQWITQNYEWFRAIWIECGELIDHYGYKWWKKQTPDMPQVQLEVIDIWHFGLSDCFAPNKPLEKIAEEIEGALHGYKFDKERFEGQGVRETTEALAAYALNHKKFSPRLFWDLLHAAELSFDELYRQYVSKNVLNIFRQDHGYKEGSYQKVWRGREDNEHLSELLQQLDASAADYSDRLYAALSQRYREATA
jgi:dimeric dUTPase (all-alpha-NTP-PPase superfamily)